MEEEDFFHLSIDNAISIFREGLVALIPVAEGIGLTWQDANSHDEWERLVDCLYDVVVTTPAKISARSAVLELPMARYDYDFTSFADFSWIELAAVELSPSFVLLRLLSSESPFDTAQFAQVDGQGMVLDRIVMPLHGLEFRLRRRFDDGSFVFVKTLTLDE
jgi:hypothetical protein